eukprot:gnl/TRDRNA2_/TRDRNA2_88301_c0_seq1.p1 gnl/TRDRNA2_/TRDRNA2_88301_c0~~gnl/TRDRNA2_/TRDRNA2_88301_c0_seq1.p1  ORF type:complete len:209 (+),score=28.97 gnl/TRDRNA2_/TRDRNA2_88301_c0_seq1:54-680(+)
MVECAERRYWERLYAEAAPDVEDREWYTGWSQLREALCDVSGPLGASALVAPSLVLELGCGGRDLAPCMIAEGFEVVGVDFSPTAVMLAQTRMRRLPWYSLGHSSYVVGDARMLPFRSGSFDIVLEKGCLDAMGTADRQAILVESCRVLHPGGCFISICNNDGLLDRLAQTVTGFSKLPGTPFHAPDSDDEAPIMIHCYLRIGGSPAG